MGIEDRAYVRSSNYGSYSGGIDAPMCRRLLIVTIAVFLLQIFSTRTVTIDEADAVRETIREQWRQMDLTVTEEDLDLVMESAMLDRVSVVQKWLQLETHKVLQGQVWRLLTSAFCHDRYSLWHIAMNMLFFWWFGPTLESMYGSREFLLFYLSAAVVSSLAYMGLDLATGDPTPEIGASGAVMAVTCLFAYHFPTHIIRIFFIFPVEVRWLVIVYAIVELHPVLLQLSGESFNDGVAHAAHLGGLAFGYLYSRRQWRLSRWVHSVQKRVPRNAPRESREIIPFPQRHVFRASTVSRLDEILEKISLSGRDSLTPEEEAVLLEESERIKNRR